MTISLSYAEERFSFFNALCFNDELPPVPFVLTRSSTFLGKLRYKRERKSFGRVKNTDFQIRLSSCFDLSPQVWDDVIIHEMIHYFIAFKGIRDSSSHGSVFREMMVNINNQFGRHITISHRVSSSQPSSHLSRKRTHFICISTFQDGEQGITICSENMAPTINKGLPRHYKLVNRKWYVSEDTFFNRFPHSRLPRIYLINSSEFREHLELATPLDKLGL